MLLYKRPCTALSSGRSRCVLLALGKELFPLDEACLLDSVFLFQGRNTVESLGVLVLRPR